LNARKLLDRFEEEETKLAHVLPRFDEEDRTADRARGSNEMSAQRAPLHLEDTTGERPPLHLDDSDDHHKKVRGPSPSPLPRGGAGGLGETGAPPASTRGKAAAQPPIPPEPRSERRKPTAAPPQSPPPAPVRAPTNIPPSGPVFGGSGSPTGAAPLAMLSDPSGARGPTPTAPQLFESSPGTRASSAPPVAGFGGFAGINRRWWIIVAGAAVIAALSFLITSAVLETPAESEATKGSAGALDAAAAEPDAAAAPDAGVPVDAGKKKPR
jgi:hypothetical protein